MLSFNYDGVRRFLRGIERCPFHTCEKHFVQSESTCHNVPLFANAVNTFIPSLLTNKLKKKYSVLQNVIEIMWMELNKIIQDGSICRDLTQRTVKEKVWNLIVIISVNINVGKYNKLMSKRKQIYSRLSFSYSSAKNSVKL